MSADQSRFLMDRFVEAFNRHDVDGMSAPYAVDCVFHGAPPWPDNIGLDREYARAMFTAFPDARLTVEEVIVSGHSIATRWHIEATHSGPLAYPPIPPTGESVIIVGSTIDHVVNNEIVDEWQFSEMLALLAQLGCLPQKQFALSRVPVASPIPAGAWEWK
jgi:predicted ester cyclase